MDEPERPARHAAHADAVIANFAASGGFTRSAGRTSTTTAEPSDIRAK